MNAFGAIEWGALTAFIMLQIALGGVVVRLMDRLNKAEAKATSAADNVKMTFSLIDRMEGELVAHRVESAKSFVSHDTLRQIESRIMGAIEHLGERIDKSLHRV